MDEVVKDERIPNYSDALYGIQDIMREHSLTLEQAFYILCKFYNIEQDKSMQVEGTLYNKGLIKDKKVNATLLFHLKRPVQTTLDLAFESKPIGTEFTLDRATRIEKEFVLDEFLDEKERKIVADKHFKGDKVLARYFIIFRSLFPVNMKRNSKWNKKFGFTYTGYDMWDDHPRVSKKFIEIYKKFDIGIFLEATYKRMRSAVNLEQETCFMVKPYKHMLSFDMYYREVLSDLEKASKKKDKTGVKSKIDKLKV
jgi:hypothetical protein